VVRKNDAPPINEQAQLTHGVQGVVKLEDQTLHLIVGLNADQYAAEMKGQVTGA